MACSLPEDWEFAAFFECEPTLLDVDAPWIYNTLTFETVRGDYSIWFQISPSYSALRFKISHGAEEIAAADIRAFTELQFITELACETLQVRFGDNQTIWLRLKPNVSFAVSG